MPRTRLVSLLGLVCLLPASKVVWAADDLPVLVYVCPRATSAPVLDGRLDDPAWASAPVADDFTTYPDGQPAPVQTSFRVVYDEQALYLGVTCREPSSELIKVIPRDRDNMSIFGEESAEVFLDPSHSHARFYQVAFNVAGSPYDGLGMDRAWDSQRPGPGRVGSRAVPAASEPHRSRLAGSPGSPAVAPVAQDTRAATGRGSSRPGRQSSAL